MCARLFRCSRRRIAPTIGRFPIPMPLEDPSIATPPEQLADVHMRDRFMFARYAWSAIGAPRDAHGMSS